MDSPRTASAVPEEGVGRGELTCVGVGCVGVGVLTTVGVLVITWVGVIETVGTLVGVGKTVGEGEGVFVAAGVGVGSFRLTVNKLISSDAGPVLSPV